MRIIRDLTPKQERVLRFIQRKIVESGIPPTIREIASGFNFSSTGTVRDYLNVFKNRGYIKITPRKSRAIEISKRIGFRIPVLGTVLAGIPDFAVEEIEEYLDLDDFSTRPDREIFCLRIRGDSLIERGIHEGDFAIVRKQLLAEDGELVVALLDKETAVKIFRKKPNKIYLEAANKKYLPIYKKFKIIGRVIAILKKF